MQTQSNWGQSTQRPVDKCWTHATWHHIRVVAGVAFFCLGGRVAVHQNRSSPRGLDRF